MTRTLTFVIPDALNGVDVRTFIRKELGFSARILTALKYEGIMLRNGEPIRSVDKLCGGDVLCLTLYDESAAYEPVPAELSVLYEDEDFLVLDKPAGMPVHPSPGHDQDSVLNAAAWYFRNEANFTFRPLYRLDRDTTGALVLAKNKFAASANLEKTYLAVCEGEVPEAGVINQPIGIKPGHTLQRCVGIGQPAFTEFKRIQTNGQYSLVEFHLRTGRTHQIRVHMSSIGHPVAGDDFYGGHLDRTNQQMLCCNRVTISCPALQKNLEITADFSEMQKRSFPELFHINKTTP